MGYTAAALRSWPVRCTFEENSCPISHVRIIGKMCCCIVAGWKLKTMVGVEWKSALSGLKEESNSGHDEHPRFLIERLTQDSSGALKFKKMRSHKWLMCSRICGNWRPALRLRCFRFLFLASLALSCVGRLVKHKMHLPYKNYGIKTRNVEEFYQNTHSSERLKAKCNRLLLTACGSLASEMAPVCCF